MSYIKVGYIPREENWGYTAEEWDRIYKINQIFDGCAYENWKINQ